MAGRLLFVYNPHSGAQNYSTRISDIISVLSKEGYRVEVFPTQKQGDARERIKNIEPEFSRVVVAGGDGTLNEAVNGIMDGNVEIPLGYIPMGSTNDFSRSLGIPQRILKAAEVAVTGDVRKVDIGSFGDEHFVYIAAFGAFTSVAYETDQKLKNAFGHAAYLLNSIKSWADIKPFRMTVEMDGMKKTEDYIYGMVTNSKSVGGMKNIAGKYVELADGLFEVTLIKRMNTIFDIPDIVTHLLNGTLESEFIESYKTNDITIRSRYKIPWTIDGEFGGNHKSVHIVNNHLALNMIM